MYRLQRSPSRAPSGMSWTAPTTLCPLLDSLLGQLLHPDPKQRPSPAQALSHEWFAHWAPASASGVLLPLCTPPASHSGASLALPQPARVLGRGFHAVVVQGTLSAAPAGWRGLGAASLGEHGGGEEAVPVAVKLQLYGGDRCRERRILRALPPHANVRVFGTCTISVCRYMCLCCHPMPMCVCLALAL